MGVSRQTALETTKCPVCESKPGEGCTTISHMRIVPRASLHQERIQAAGRGRRAGVSRTIGLIGAYTRAWD